MSNIPVNKPKRKRRSRRIISRIADYAERVSRIVIFLFSILVCSISLIVITRLVARQDDFCTVDNPIYQVLSENAGDWMSNYLVPYSQAKLQQHSFSVDGNGRTYYAEPYWEETTDEKASLLYIITGSDKNYYGSEGYIYAPSGEMNLKNWLDNYWIKQLDETIYCYKF